MRGSWGIAHKEIEKRLNCKPELVMLISRVYWVNSEHLPTLPPCSAAWAMPVANDVTASIV